MKLIVFFLLCLAVISLNSNVLASPSEIRVRFEEEHLQSKRVLVNYPGRKRIAYAMWGSFFEAYNMDNKKLLYRHNFKRIPWVVNFFRERLDGRCDNKYIEHFIAILERLRDLHTHDSSSYEAIAKGFAVCRILDINFDFGPIKTINKTTAKKLIKEAREYFCSVIRCCSMRYI